MVMCPSVQVVSFPPMAKGIQLVKVLVLEKQSISWAGT
jgi:hypothetical protein